MSKVSEHIQSFINSFVNGNTAEAREHARAALDIRQSEIIQTERDAVRSFTPQSDKE